MEDEQPPIKPAEASGQPTEAAPAPVSEMHEPPTSTDGASDGGVPSNQSEGDVQADQQAQNAPAVTTAPEPKKSSGSGKAGIIVLTVVIMIVLTALAVYAYMQ